MFAVGAGLVLMLVRMEWATTDGTDRSSLLQPPPPRTEASTLAELPGLANEPFAPTMAGPAATGSSKPSVPRNLEQTELQAVDIWAVDPSGQPVAGADVLVCDSPAVNVTELIQRLIVAREAGPEAEQAVLKAGAVLGQASRPDWEAPSAHLRTDDKGYCRITFTTGSGYVYLEKEGVGTSGIWHALSRESDPTGSQPLGGRAVRASHARLVLQPKAVVQGVVLDAHDQPLGGADIDVDKYLGSVGRSDGTQPRHPGAVVADAHGAFEFGLDAPCYFGVSARLASQLTETVRSSVEPGEVLSLELRVPGAFAVTGFVVGPDGEPVADADVEVAGRNAPHVPASKSGADGTFELPLTRPGEFELHVSASGLVQGRPQRFRISVEKPRPNLHVELLEARSITGRLRWSSGEAIPQAMVSASSQRRDLGEEYSGFGAITDRRAMTDREGCFELVSLHPDMVYDLHCFVSLTANTWVRDVAPGTRDLEVMLDREAAKGVSITLVVVDEDSGVPVRSYWVQHGNFINGVTDDSPTEWIDNPAGRFVKGGCRPDGSYGFVVRAEGYARRQLGPVTPGPEGAELTVCLGREGGVRVVVVDADGSAINGAHVLLAEALSDDFDRFEYFRTEVTDDQGIATFENEPPGRYVVLAHGASLDSDLLRLDVRSGRTTDARLVVTPVRQGELEVLVVQADGSPFVDAEVMLTQLTEFTAARGWDSPDLFPENLRTDATGRFLLDLAPGLYLVYVSPEANVFIPPKQAQVFAGHRSLLTFSEER